MIISQ